MVDRADEQAGKKHIIGTYFSTEYFFSNRVKQTLCEMVIWVGNHRVEAVGNVNCPTNVRVKIARRLPKKCLIR